MTLSGSLPPGVPIDFYADVIKIARKENVLTFLDSSGDALRKGVEAGPFFVKPNEAEARNLLDLKSTEPLDFAQIATEISKRYVTNVLLSLGAKGAIAMQSGEIIFAKSPSVNVKSAVGSGDCMLAGLAYGCLHGLSFKDAVVCGVAAGTANTLKIGAGQFDVEDFERLRGQIQLSDEVQ